jgi:hypothetical protein
MKYLHIHNLLRKRAWRDQIRPYDRDELTRIIDLYNWHMKTPPLEVMRFYVFELGQLRRAIGGK